jgi:hypothetical protein
MNGETLQDNMCVHWPAEVPIHPEFRKAVTESGLKGRVFESIGKLSKNKSRAGNIRELKISTGTF